MYFIEKLYQDMHSVKRLFSYTQNVIITIDLIKNTFIFHITLVLIRDLKYLLSRPQKPIATGSTILTPTSSASAALDFNHTVHFLCCHRYRYGRIKIPSNFLATCTQISERVQWHYFYTCSVVGLGPSQS